MTGNDAKLKNLLGALLVLLAIALLVFWEAQGRAMLLMDEVYIAREPIAAGEMLSPELFRMVRVPRDALIEAAVTPGNSGQLKGKAAIEPIRKGAQLSALSLRAPDAKPEPETSCFVIKQEWIEMCSSSLRRGDTVTLYSEDGLRDFGSFPVAYVKDSEGREVTDATAGMRAFTDTDEARANATSQIHHVEIRCEWPAYRTVRNWCETERGKLLLVRKEQPK